MNSNIKFYLKLFEGLRDNINFFLYDNIIIKNVEDYKSESLKKFSLMLMFSQDAGKTFRWLLLEDQKKEIIFRLEKSSILKTLNVSSEQFFKYWINFKFGESGLIKYFVQTHKNTEFIKNFLDEPYLVKGGYEKDYTKQPEFLNERNNYRTLLKNNNFDPFVELENGWGFKDVAFYYVKLPKLKDIEFVAIFPILTQEQKDFFEKADFIFSMVKNATLGANLMREIIDENLKELFAQQLKTAIISILIDSYAHNISAHSLAALKWWVELRYKMLDKRFSVPIESDEEGKFPELFPLKLQSIDADKTKVTTKKYYEALGLTDSSYDEGFYSLYDFLQFADQDTSYKLFSFTEKVKLLGKDSSGKEKVKNEFNPRFPVPIDYALYPFFRFLRDKGAFWSGVTRDVSNGGETKTWYKILWEDFANNPLYLGTIAKSEGITKININLAVKSGEEFYHGRFVTIDLSAIKYEEKLANDPNLKLKEDDKHLLEIKHKDEEHCSLDDCNCSEDHKLLKEEKNCFHNNDNRYVETRSYSKYAFVRLGKCFAHFREILDTEEFTAYLPGGIIGEHALFTIFENQIRNIKHYKNDLDEIEENGIDFWISIEKDKLNFYTKEITSETENQKTNTEDEKEKSQLFKVGVWLAHATDLGNEKTVDDKQNYDDVLIKKVMDSTIQPILDDNGSPRMGGNSQDKACAAMLFNNEFKAVERKNNDKEKRYFPWITFATAPVEKPFDAVCIDKGKDERYADLTEDDKKNEYAKDYLKNIGIEKEINKKYGYLKKYIYLWQGADYFEVKDVKDLEGENVSRFKFAIVNVDGEKKKEINLKLRRDGVIRILENILIDEKNEKSGIKQKIEKEVAIEYDTNRDSFIKQFVSVKKETNRRVLEFLYNCWLQKWIGNEKYIIKFNEGGTGGNVKSRMIFSVDRIEYKSDLHDNEIYNDYLKQEIPLAHGTKDEEKSCNIRSHGYFWGKYFNDIKDKQVGHLKIDEKDHKRPYSFHKNKNQFLYELFEVFSTQIIIYDNRLGERFEKLSIDKRKVFNDNLRLKICKEKLSKGVKNFEEELEKAIGDISQLPTVLIIHLSFIESLKIDEKNIDKFINKYLRKYIENDKFFFVVTTGRGRDLWRSSLEDKREQNYSILNKTLFKPVESLLNAIESGISYNDNFDTKYNLIKIIFGS